MNETKPMKRQCSATNRQGNRCGRAPILGGFVCRLHGGAAPQVARAAAIRVADMLAEALDPNRVLREAGRLAYSDIRELFDDQGNFLPIKQWPDDVARAVASVEVVKKNVTTGDGKVDDVLKVRLWDKPGKLRDLMEHHGQLERSGVTINVVNLVGRLAEGRKRVARLRGAQQDVVEVPTEDVKALSD